MLPWIFGVLLLLNVLLFVMGYQREKSREPQLLPVPETEYEIRLVAEIEHLPSPNEQEEVSEEMGDSDPEAAGAPISASAAVTADQTTAGTETTAAMEPQTSPIEAPPPSQDPAADKEPQADAKKDAETETAPSDGRETNQKEDAPVADASDQRDTNEANEHSNTDATTESGTAAADHTAESVTRGDSQEPITATDLNKSGRRPTDPTETEPLRTEPRDKSLATEDPYRLSTEPTKRLSPKPRSLGVGEEGARSGI